MNAQFSISKPRLVDTCAVALVYEPDIFRICTVGVFIFYLTRIKINAEENKCMISEQNSTETWSN